MVRRCFLAGAGTCLALLSVLAPAVAEDREPKIVDNIVVRSFDDTPIVATLMLPPGASRHDPVPAILNTHGWGGTRSVTPTAFQDRLLRAGYAILTWDARGFGDSGGEAHIDAPAFEVRDTIELIDYLASRPEIQKDAPGDPRFGWYGGSYAGGIQLNTAAFDHRVEAIVPEIPWGDLVQDLYPNRVLKKTWDQLLYGAGLASGAANGLDAAQGPQVGVYARQIHEAEAIGTATGELPNDLVEWFRKKSTVLYVHRITAPTMIVQGTVDTLFPLEDGFELYRILEERRGVPVKLVTYCGGHTLGCPYPGGTTGYPDDTDADSGNHYEDLVVRWLDRYVKEKPVATGPELEWQAQDGYYYGAPQWPLPQTNHVVGSKMEATLVGPGATGGDAPAAGDPAPVGEIGSMAARQQILGPAPRSRAIVGIPRVRLSATLTGVGGVLFFELVDRGPDGTLTTVDDQTMPLRVAAGETAETLELHGVSWLLKPGHSLLLEVTTGSTQYDISRYGPYAVTFTARPEVPLTSVGASERARTTG